MVIQTLYQLPNGTPIRYPIRIVDNPDERFSSSGKRRKLYMTPEEYEWRCQQVVSPTNFEDCYGRRPAPDPGAIGIPFIYFRIGFAGELRNLIGPATEEQKRISYRHYHDNPEHSQILMRRFFEDNPDYLQTYYSEEVKERYRAYSREYQKQRYARLKSNPQRYQEHLALKRAQYHASKSKSK